MEFCENCNLLTEQTACPVCGKKSREVKADDFCFFAETDYFNYEMLQHTLNENNIDAVFVPFYSAGVTRATAGRADGRRVFVRYKNLNTVKEIFKTLFSQKNDNT